MRNRIRNILLEALILESPLFRAVGVMYRGEVHEGTFGMYHGDLIDEVLPDITTPQYRELLNSGELVEGFITLDGKFVSRVHAKKMVEDPESYAMRVNGEMVNVESDMAIA